MRGLIFTGGNQPNLENAKRFFPPYTLVVAADSGLCNAEKLAIMPDYIVGDMDSIPDPSVLKKYPQEIIQQWPMDKDYTDTELAFRLMAEKKIDEILLIGGSGGRLDHFFALKKIFEQSSYQGMWFTEESISITIERGSLGSGILITGLTYNDPVSVFSVGKGPHFCKGEKFQWNIDTLDWNKGQYSLSNRAETDSIRIESVSGRFLVIVPLNAQITLIRY